MPQDDKPPRQTRRSGRGLLKPTPLKELQQGPRVMPQAPTPAPPPPEVQRIVPLDRPMPAPGALDTRPSPKLDTGPLPKLTPKPGPGLQVERVPEGLGGFQIPVLPLLQQETHLFSAGRRGRAVVRDADLLALRIELIGLRTVTQGAGKPPRLEVQPGADPVALVLHLPPQAQGEQTFFHVKAGEPAAEAPAGKPAASGNEVPLPPPVKGRSAEESRLAFRVPAGFQCDYTLEALLGAVRQLEPAVVPTAQAPGRKAGVPSRWFTETLKVDRAVIPNRSLRAAALQAGASARGAQGLRVGKGKATTLPVSGGPLPGAAQLARQARRQQQLMKQDGADSPLLARREDRLRFVDPGSMLADSVVKPLQPPAPRAPLAHETALELPWRLILSPHAGGRWQHALAPVTSPRTGRTELWHSRLGDLPEGSPAGAMLRDPAVRAVWARDGLGGEAPRNAQGQAAPMRGSFSGADGLPAPDDQGLAPFRLPMDDHDRQQIVHLSSNFGLAKYTPEAIRARRLMVSALGGWLDARGAWAPPEGLSVEEWVHRAALGRDHAVRIVYQGRLFPFGHRAVLVKVSERGFYKETDDPGAQPLLEGNTAYLRQRMFIVVGEPERSYTDASLKTADGASFLRRFPFARVRINTLITPDLQPPQPIGSGSGRVFWPLLASDTPFRFGCTGTDLEGRRVDFELPMIFIDAIASRPLKDKGPDGKPLKKPVVDSQAALARLKQVQAAWRSKAQQTASAAQDWTPGDWTAAATRGQRLSLAPEDKPGDTSVEALWLRFDAEIDNDAQTTGLLAHAGSRLEAPYFFPAIRDLQARIGASTVLGGSRSSNRLSFNSRYLKHGLDHAENLGKVFAEVLPQTGMAALDFSKQGNRSGGFVMPNLSPRALSRLAGPVGGDVEKFATALGQGGGMFSGGAVPLPLLFGCIPLGSVVKELADLGQVPKFVTDAADVVGQLMGEVERLMGGADPLAGLAAALGRAATAALKSTVQDLIAQAQQQVAGPMAQAAAKAKQVEQKLTALETALTQLIASPLGDSLSAADPAAASAALGTLQQRLDALGLALDELLTALSLPGLPPGWLQELRTVLGQARRLLEDLARLPTLVQQGTVLIEALGELLKLLSELDDSDEAAKVALLARLQAVNAAGDTFRGTLQTLQLLEGAPRKLLVDGLTALDAAVTVAEKAVDLLFGEELTVRFDWAPQIQSVPSAKGQEIFRANDPKGFVVAVVAKVKKSSGDPSMEVVCSLKHFDLVLIGAAGFLELNFEKIEFRADADLKTNVDVKFSGIKFIGPLSFVESLRDLIPLDGFSDPPYLDVSPKGIDAGFSLALPNVAVGMFSLSNLSLGAGFTVPFIGQPLSVRFNFCTREQPFCLTVAMLGGGGFFGITVDPKGVQLLEAALEFGACLSLNFGVASGSVHVMAGLYFRMQQSDCSLTGYLRIGGEVDVLGIISASIELYMALEYQSQTGKVVGRATITVEISIFCFSASVKVSAERKFAGSNGDPSFRQLMGPEVAVLTTTPIEADLQALDGGETCAWHAYAAAFA